MDVIVAGTGIAGLLTADELSRRGYRVLMVSPGLRRSSSYRAQGGVAAPVLEEDSIEAHLRDTLKAGDGLGDRQRIIQMISEGRKILLELIEEGFPFDREDGRLALSMEGGHSRRRILHSGGVQTGRNLVEFFLERLEGRVEHVKGYVVDVIVDEDKVRGVVVWDGEGIRIIYSRAVVVAAGGYASLYTKSTNPDTSRGILMWNLYRRGLPLENLEFVQFHPTVFHAPDGTRILISEAIRGDGAILIDEKGERFVNERDTRDRVARAIFRKGRVYLYAGHLDRNLLLEKYAMLVDRLKEYGYDLTRDSIPVYPAAHYTIGGVKTDLDGRTEISGLRVIGEAASTRVHGANRLASNSLLEAMVMARRTARALVDELPFLDYREVPYFPDPVPLEIPGRELLDRYAFVERDGEELRDVVESIEDGPVRLILRSALIREESRGVHYRKDFPQKDDRFRGYIVWHRGEWSWEPLK